MDFLWTDVVQRLQALQCTCNLFSERDWWWRRDFAQTVIFSAALVLDTISEVEKLDVNAVTELTKGLSQRPWKGWQAHDPRHLGSQAMTSLQLCMLQLHSILTPWRSYVDNLEKGH